MTSLFEYYELAHSTQGVSSGFKYKTVPRITLGSLAKDEPAKEEVLFDQPLIDKKRKRVADHSLWKRSLLKESGVLRMWKSSPSRCEHRPFRSNKGTERLD